MVVFSTSPGKRAAVEALGAQFINSNDPADMAAITGSPPASRPLDALIIAPSNSPPTARVPPIHHPTCLYIYFIPLIQPLFSSSNRHMNCYDRRMAHALPDAFRVGGNPACGLGLRV